MIFKWLALIIIPIALMSGLIAYKKFEIGRGSKIFLWSILGLCIISLIFWLITLDKASRMGGDAGMGAAILLIFLILVIAIPFFIWFVIKLIKESRKIKGQWPGWKKGGLIGAIIGGIFNVINFIFTVLYFIVGGVFRKD